MKTKGILLFGALALILISCAPVLNRSVMRESARDVSFAALRENPEPYMGKLYILGGIIVKAEFTKAGSQLEAVHVPVDRLGYFLDRGRSEGRFLAVSDGQALDPAVYGRGRRVTLAGEFIATRTGKIDDIEYRYPVFQIRQIYLWPQKRGHNPPPQYYSPWFYPFPYYYGGPWWSDYYYGPMSPPIQRRAPPPARSREGREPERR